MKTTTKYNCPICLVPMVSHPGTRLNVTDGVTMWCENKGCEAQEVFAHEKNESACFDNIKDKYKPLKKF